MGKGIALCALLAVLFFGPSVASDRSSSAWTGRDKADLVEKFGRPQYVVTDDQRGQVFVYMPLDSVTKAVAVTGGALPTLSALMGFDAYRMFYVDASSKIYRVESKGRAFRWSPPWWW